MADIQIDNGNYLKIANKLVEALAKTYLSSYETQVIFAIFRKTYGYQKKEDWISNSQLSEMTGIAKSNITRTIKKLLDRNMLVKKGKKIGFQKDFEKWQKLSKQITNENNKKSYLNRQPELSKQITGVIQTDNKKLSKQIPTKDNKETYTKETITKEKGDVFSKALKDFKVMRNKIKKPVTKRAESRLINKLDKLTKDKETQVAILEQSIFHCWLDVYPLKQDFVKTGCANSIKQMVEEDDFEWRND